ncbi:uncharacterized protein K460DRAFT_293388 [Cucurbitaria berberidis CBS 394.84]|uniref:Uncharacterized protein n=1 Tax=Cucurbitaria berberidis CBS 394.84 TaxID=1168544 RepID=A0A9P4G9J9_9PLEO|nr:uncharacterized protein K460DRAFT_293388 [Cucurbitaria berberidis CBS 394.84]KAF1841562.1 hypothetical protein K460DRAFT_293388 [Cucurbitaria berberidis CBS 394.84]
MAGDKEISFSGREMEVLALAWQCMEGQPKVHAAPSLDAATTFRVPYDPFHDKIDMQKLARLTGYTPGSASVTFGNIKRKIKLLGDSLSGNGPATPKKGGAGGRSKTATPKRSGGGGKRGLTAAQNDTPSKKRQKTGGRKAREEIEHEDEVEEEEEERDLASSVIKKEDVIEDREASYGFLNQLTQAADLGDRQGSAFGGDDDEEY